MTASLSHQREFYVDRIAKTTRTDIVQIGDLNDFTASSAGGKLAESFCPRKRQLLSLRDGSHPHQDARENRFSYDIRGDICFYSPLVVTCVLSSMACGFRIKPYDDRVISIPLMTRYTCLLSQCSLLACRMVILPY
jgi:hypothetical protein